MIYVLIEQDCNTINSVEYSVMEKFHKRSIHRVGKEVTLDFSIPPLFNDNWLILLKPEGISCLDKVYPQKNLVLIKVKNRSSAEDVVSSLGDNDYRIIDNYFVDHDVVVQWIKEQLPNVDAEYIWKRSSGRLKNVIEGVEILKTLDSDANRNDVDNAVKKAKEGSIKSVVEMMISAKCDVGYNDVLEFLWEFRYAFRWLKDSILKELNLWLSIFSAADEGRLSQSNIDDFRKELNSDRLSHYRIFRMLEDHRSVSTELVTCIILLIKQKKADSLFVVEVIKLLKAGIYGG